MIDQIDFAQAVIANWESPDIRSWPIMAGISRVIFADRERWQRGNVYLDFPGKTQLQPGYGNQGAISYTIWGGNRIDGRWYFAPWVECIGDDYIPTGNLFAPNQVAENLLYFADAPLHKYQPKAGEQIALVATTGDTRRQNAQPVGFQVRRTNVVLVPFQVGEWAFVQGTPAEPSAPPVEPTQTPTDHTVPVSMIAPLLEHLIKLAEMQAVHLSALERKLDAVGSASGTVTFPTYTGRLKIDGSLPWPLANVKIDTPIVLKPE